MDSDIAVMDAAGESPGKNQIYQGLIFCSDKEKVVICYIKASQPLNLWAFQQCREDVGKAKT
jgi:hypothetical protein